jgi:hypothetical protein
LVQLRLLRRVTQQRRSTGKSIYKRFFSSALIPEGRAYARRREQRLSHVDSPAHAASTFLTPPFRFISTAIISGGFQLMRALTGLRRQMGV